MAALWADQPEHGRLLPGGPAVLPPEANKVRRGDRTHNELEIGRHGSSAPQNLIPEGKVTIGYLTEA